MKVDIEKFKKIKSKIQTLFPNAKTAIDSFGKFYITDSIGRSILDYQLYPHFKTVFDAWFYTERALYSEKIIKINSNRFNEHKQSDIQIYR